jgi:hypothetical protein
VRRVTAGSRVLRLAASQPCGVAAPHSFVSRSLTLFGGAAVVSIRHAKQILLPRVCSTLDGAPGSASPWQRSHDRYALDLQALQAAAQSARAAPDRVGLARGRGQSAGLTRLRHRFARAEGRIPTVEAPLERRTVFETVALSSAVPRPHGCAPLSRLGSSRIPLPKPTEIERK